MLVGVEAAAGLGNFHGSRMHSCERTKQLFFVFVRNPKCGLTGCRFGLSLFSCRFRTVIMALPKEAYKPASLRAQPPVLPIAPRMISTIRLG